MAFWVSFKFVLSFCGSKGLCFTCALNSLQVRTTSPAAFTRATVVIAVKYSIVERPEKIDEIIYPEISSFLMLIKDHDRVSCNYILL